VVVKCGMLIAIMSAAAIAIARFAVLAWPVDPMGGAYVSHGSLAVAIQFRRTSAGCKTDELLPNWRTATRRFKAGI
jgi:hypothetical protein